MSWPADGGLYVCGGDDRLMDRRVFIGSLALATLAMPQAVFAEPVRNRAGKSGIAAE